MLGSGIGAGDLRSRDIHAELYAQSAIRKTVDGSILRPELQDSPRSVSPDRDPRRKISKVVDPHDTNHRNRKHWAPRNVLVRPPGFEFPDHRTDGLTGRWVGSPLDASAMS